MKFSFLYQPVDDIEAAAEFHRDVLGQQEAWREGTEAIAFWLPDRVGQIMIATDGLPAGPMYLVEAIDPWAADHDQLEMAVPKFAIPGGAVIGYVGPGNNVFYVFDQADA